MAPQRDADLHLLADGLVILVERVVLLVGEMQHGRMHHDVVGADRLRVPGEIDDGVEILIRARQDRAMAAQLFDRYVEAALALGDRHGEELALLAADENAVDAEIVDPVAQGPAQARLVDRQVGRKRRQRRRPNALEMLAGIILRIASSVVHWPAPYLIRLL